MCKVRTKPESCKSNCSLWLEYNFCDKCTSDFQSLTLEEIHLILDEIILTTRRTK